MNFKSFFNKKPKNIFSEFATKSLSESVKIFLTAIASGITHSTPIGFIIGAGGKGMMDALLTKSSQIEKKIDILIREPLLTGINFLYHGLMYPETDDNSKIEKNKILHDAHIALTRAWALNLDSTEDSLFIRSLDAIALSAHSVHWQTANNYLDKLAIDLDAQILKVEVLEKEMREQIEYNEANQRFFSNKDYRDKPFGFAEQRLWARNLKSFTDKLVKSTQDFRDRIDILICLNKFAKSLLIIQEHRDVI